MIARQHPGRFQTTTHSEKRIDFVYCTPVLYDCVTRAEVVRDDYTEPVRDPKKLSNFWHPSDHRPIVVDFDLKKAKKQYLQKIEQTMKQLEMLYEGKAKQVFRTDDDDVILMHYKDAATAFNNIKKATIEGKGVLNNKISTIIFGYLKEAGIPTHYISTLNERDQLCRRVKIIPLEVIVRNIVAGSMAKRLGLEEGLRPSNTIYDICYKCDELGDPLINDHHAVALGVVTYDELKRIYDMTAKINEVLTGLFDRMNITLVDFKIEFGRTSDGQIVLADEVSPDTCRLWDKTTNEKLDKDRFRRDLGRVREAYEEILARLEALKK